MLSKNEARLIAANIAKLLLVEIKAQFSAPLLGSVEPISEIHRRGVMVKIITKNMFDAAAGLTIIAVVFYLAAILHIMPVPENALNRINEIATDVMGVLIWLISFLQ